MAKKIRFSILDAVDNLSSMAEIEKEELTSETAALARIWFDPQDREKTYCNVKETFKAVHAYLKRIYTNKQANLQERKTQQGLQAIMQLADEAAQKISSCFNTTHIKEADDLKAFYEGKIASRFQDVLQEEEEWQEEWGSGQADVTDIARVALQDFETVKRDREYELFYIKKEDGTPFFTKNLVRHIKLVHDFDELIAATEGEDPFVKLPELQEKDIHEAAKEMRAFIAKALREFYANAYKFKEDPLIRAINKAVMALFQTSNPKNCMSRTDGKSVVAYFADFQSFLREIFDLPQYQELVLQPPTPKEPLTFAALQLIQSLAYALFTRSSHTHDLVVFIRSIASKKSPSYSVWNDILNEHEALRDHLSHFPNGPLFKTIDIFHRHIKSEGFDPIRHDNYPTALFTVDFGKFDLKCQRLPCPTKQTIITKAEITEEFCNYLRMLPGKECHLLINLQNRTRWEEQARCRAIEELQKDAEFSHKLVVVTLPKQTDFYLQNRSYVKADNAIDFLRDIKKQIKNNDESGFYIPLALQREVEAFTDAILPLIHTHFFASKKTFSRKNRLDCIEIFYHFLLLKLIDLTTPSRLSLTCKDSVDTGAISTGGFYAFAKLLSKESTWDEAGKEALFFMLFGPAIQVRQRAVDSQRLGREISALSAMHLEDASKKQAILNDFLPLYSFQTISLKEAA